MVAIVSGGGQFRVGDQAFACERGDLIAVPIWTPHAFEAEVGTRLLEVSDEPVQRMLGFYRQGPAV
jgi:gentisate 1,2-dioxygenase